MSMESRSAAIVREAHLIIFDEATMADRYIFEAIDLLLKDLMNNDEPFGGKVMLCGE